MAPKPRIITSGPKVFPIPLVMEAEIWCISIPTAVPRPILTRRKEINVSILKVTTNIMSRRIAERQSTKGILENLK
jgi:hypothetical protein